MSRRTSAFRAAAAVAAFAAAGVAQAQETRIEPGGGESLALTLYPGTFALVEDVRRARLGEGRTHVSFEGVPPEMDAASVRLDAGAGSRVRAVGRSHRLLTPEALLERAVGGTVGVIRRNPKTGEQETVEAKVLSAAGSTPVLEIDGKIVTGMPGRLVFDERPADLHPRPTLTATIDAEAAQETLLRLTYLTQGLGWQADYTATLEPDGQTLELAAWATLRNDTQADFADAEVALVAGDVAREDSGAPKLMRAAEGMAASRAADMPERQALGDYHLYQLAERVTLRAQETRQVALIEAARLDYARTLVHRAGPPVWGPMRGEGEPIHPAIRIAFDNASAERRLPAGTVRVYGPDQGGRLRFLGSERIDDVPPEGSVELTVGRAFDVTVARTQTAFERLGERTTESAYDLTVSNGGDRPATVKLVETLPGEWQVLSESAEHARQGSDAVWTVEVPAKGEATLSYRVRMTP